MSTAKKRVLHFSSQPFGLFWQGPHTTVQDCPPPYQICSYSHKKADNLSEGAQEVQIQDSSSQFGK
jgi:hypothetical protein